MNVAVYMGRSQPVAKSPILLDALIVGAGVAGLCQVHQLLSQGLRVLAAKAE